jgi:hypothetical protein
MVFMYMFLPNNPMTFLIVYSKVKLKSIFLFQLIILGKASDKCLPIWILLHTSFEHILISKTSFMDITNLMRMLSNCTPMLSAVWQMQSMWSVADLLPENPHW